MRTLKYAILGLLSKGPMTGYDLAKEFNVTLVEFWTAKHSQIYPELAKLVSEELVTYEIEISGEVLEKKVYSITNKGKESFLKWLNRDEPMEQTPKDVFRLRMFYSNYIDVTSRIRMLEYQLKQHEERYLYLSDTKNNFKEIPPANSHEFGSYLVLEGAVMRESTTIEWLKNCINHCKMYK